jgi:hypothetical protein
MRKEMWTTLLAAVVTFAAVSTPLPSDAGQGRGRSRGQEPNAAANRKQDTGSRGRSNPSRIYQDAARLKGYESGWDLGLLDGRSGERYDAVRHREYRDADAGYATSYGSPEGYRTKFRAGFRQGYEDGYREGTRSKE